MSLASWAKNGTPPTPALGNNLTNVDFSAPFNFLLRNMDVGHGWVRHTLWAISVAAASGITTEKQLSPPVDSNLLKNIFSYQIFFSKYKIWGWKSPILEKFRSKVNFWAPIVYFVGNLQLCVEKLNFLHPNFHKAWFHWWLPCHEAAH